MTHEQFITLETACLAKQAGFDWECNERYYQGYSTNNSNPLCIYPKENWNQYIYLCSAPTQEILQRWLRDVKNIILLVDYDNDEDYEENEKYGITIYIGNERIVELAAYSTYEAALKAGLKKCLTILIEKL